MRVAYCLSGLARDQKEHFQYTKEGILDKWDVDVFASVWTEDYTGVFESEHEKLVELYKPVSYVFRNPCDLVTPFMTEYPRQDRWRNFDRTYPEKKKYRSSWGRTNVLNMYFQIYNANLLRKAYEELKGFQYDVVIRARADGGWAINHELLTDPNTVYLHNLKDTYPSDWFAYGSGKVMDAYSATWLNLHEAALFMEDNEVHEKTHEQAWYKWMDPHRCLKFQLEVKNPWITAKVMERAEIRSQGHRGVAEVMKERGL
jgi:hypothetical protein